MIFFKKHKDRHVSPKDLDLNRTDLEGVWTREELDFLSGKGDSADTEGAAKLNVRAATEPQW